MQPLKKLFCFVLFVFQCLAFQDLQAQAVDPPCPEPTIESSRQASEPICKGDEITLTAVFNPGPAPENVTYQWLFDGEELEDSTRSSLTFTVADSLEGAYTVRITGSLPDNPCTVATSQEYVLDINLQAGLRNGKEKGTEQPLDPGDPNSPIVQCLSHVFYATDTTVTANVQLSTPPRQWNISRYTDQQAIPGVLPPGATFLWPEPNPDRDPTDPDPAFESDSIRIDFTIPGAYNVQLIVFSETCPPDTTSTIAKVGYPIVTMPSLPPFCTREPYNLTLESEILDEQGRPTPGYVSVDRNFGTIIPGSIRWEVRGGGGFTFDSSEDNLNVTLPPSRQPYRIKFSIANECGDVEDYPEPLWENEMMLLVAPIPDAPTAAATAPVICDGQSAQLRPAGPFTTPGSGSYLWYAQESGGDPIGAGAPFSTGPLQAASTDGPTLYPFYASSINEFGCESETRTEFLVEVLPGITNNTIAGGDIETCGGQIPSPLVGSDPQGGTTPYTFRWERSSTGPTSGFTPAPLPAGTTAHGRDYAFSAPLGTGTFYYRRLVLGGASSCGNDTSQAVVITVAPALTNNDIAGTQQVCEGVTPASLTGTEAAEIGANVTFRWESSIESGTAGFAAAAGDNTGATYVFPGAVTQTTWFRRIAVSGACETPSAVVQITIVPPIENNRILENQTVCSGVTPAPLQGSTPELGDATPIYRWESSQQSASTGFAPAPGTNNERDYAFTDPLPRTTWFRRVVESANACEPIISEVVEITVVPLATDNRISAEQTICRETPPEPLTGVFPLAGNFTFRWEVSTTSATVGFVPAPGNNDAPDYAPGPVGQDTWFRRVVVGQGCEVASAAVLVRVVEIPPSPVVTTPNPVVCPGGQTTLGASGPGATFEWFTDATGGNLAFVGAEFLTPRLNATTIYYVQATSDNGCVSATRTPVTVTVTEPVAVVSDDMEIIQGRYTELRASGGDTYVWGPAESLNNPNIATPIARPQETTTYTVTVTTAEGCVLTEQVTVTVVPALDVPNAFSPNRDGVNDAWEIGNIQNYPEVVVEIFNRWGQRVYRSEGYQQPWDGRLNGQDLPMATYYYMIYLNRQEAPLSGSVTILK